MSPLLALFVLLQQHPISASHYSTPPSGDTTGYWQQRVHYRIVARLDEGRGTLRANALLTYVNNSPDTLREMYVHQHLNAFRPGSRWSQADEREGRVRFQDLADPDFAYERFTAPPTIDNVPVAPEYPGGSDSTVVRFALRRPLPPGDSVFMTFAWEARPSTLPRRQGRRGRSFDFAQWYPRVAVYDRGGWEPNPLVPAGEFYGEFGAYDVTLVVPSDQVIGATGVPIAGDPGWDGARRFGSVRRASNAYGRIGDRAEPEVPEGYKLVRFYADRVHHFAWSASPDYRYEGGVYVRAPRGASTGAVRFPTWDTVAVHVLYRPGDESTWGEGIALQRTVTALRWLERVYGPYGYPQITNLHRIEGGGTEFPMMMMNGSPSQGLILHEGGHIFTHGILANNEWRSGWMDEGLSSYQSAWFNGATPQDRALMGDSAPPLPSRPAGYAGLAVRPDPALGARTAQQNLVHIGRAEPIGTAAHEFNEFAIYNAMIYGRAEIMYGALREVLGDSTFAEFLREYYRRWAFRHVDEMAMRRTAEVTGRRESLGWFFEQWIRRVGTVDYGLADVRFTRTDDGSWETRVRLDQRGQYLHPMPLGILTADGWEITRLDAGADSAYLARSATRPLGVRLDPYLTTFDWDRRNDTLPGAFGVPGRRQLALDWPFLDQSAGDRQLALVRPWAMYSAPGGVALGFRIRSSYQGWIDRINSGFAISAGAGGEDTELANAGRWRNLWFTWENPTLGGPSPLVGARMGAWYVDDAIRLDLAKSWDVSRFTVGPQRTRTLALTAIAPNGLAYLDPAKWETVGTYELSIADVSLGAPDDSLPVTVQVGAGVATPPGVSLASMDPYVRLASEVAAATSLGGGWELGARAFIGYSSDDTPLQRKFRLSSLDAVETFANHFLRSRGSPLAQPSVHYTPFGGGGFRGYDPRVTASEIVAANVELIRPIVTFGSGSRILGLAGHVFGHFGTAKLTGEDDTRTLGGAGVGVAFTGWLYDWPFRIRVDAPVYLTDPELSIAGESVSRKTGWRWTFSFE